MRFVRDAGMGRELSVLGFGAAAVLGRVGRRDSLLALGAALDAGINVFDTARSYGYGESEALLGEFFQGRRDEVVISTKFGIVPSPQAGWKRLAKPVARMAMQAVPGLKQKLRGQVAAQFQPGQLTVAVLTESVEASLRKLRTEYLDILLMHEATLEAARSGELLGAMERLRVAGKVRVIGVSAEPEIVAAAMDNAAVGAVQFACHAGNGFAAVVGQKKTAQPVLRMANHVFGGAEGVAGLQQKLQLLMEREDLREGLREKLSAGGETLPAELVLNQALNAGNTVVLASMMKPRHLKVNARAVTECRFNAEELGEVFDWLARV